MIFHLNNDAKLWRKNGVFFEWNLTLLFGQQIKFSTEFLIKSPCCAYKYVPPSKTKKKQQRNYSKTKTLQSIFVEKSNFSEKFVHSFDFQLVWFSTFARHSPLGFYFGNCCRYLQTPLFRNTLNLKEFKFVFVQKSDDFHASLSKRDNPNWPNNS